MRRGTKLRPRCRRADGCTSNDVRKRRPQRGCGSAPPRPRPHWCRSVGGAVPIPFSGGGCGGALGVRIPGAGDGGWGGLGDAVTHFAAVVLVLAATTDVSDAVTTL